MNKTNSQEIIRLNDDWYFEKDNEGYFVLMGPAGGLNHWEEDDARAFADSLQPQVSRDELSLAEEICDDKCRVCGKYGGNIVRVSTILAKHRQPAAMSDDAVELTKSLYIKGYIPLGSIEAVETAVQAAMDACRLDGARKMQEAAATLCEKYQKGGYFDAGAIRALSTETVIK